MNVFEFMPTVISPVMDVQRRSINSLETAGIVVFPGPGVTLPMFRKPESLPRCYFPESFLLAASKIIPSAGKLTIYRIWIILFATFECMALCFRKRLC